MSQGEWQDDMPHGEGTLTIAATNTYYQGPFIQGKPEHVAMKLNAMYWVEEAPPLAGKGAAKKAGTMMATPAAAAVSPAKAAAAGGGTSAGGRVAATAAAGNARSSMDDSSSGKLAQEEPPQPLQLQLGQPLPVQVMVAAQCGCVAGVGNAGPAAAGSSCEAYAGAATEPIAGSQATAVAKPRTDAGTATKPTKQAAGAASAKAAAAAVQQGGAPGPAASADVSRKLVVGEVAPVGEHWVTANMLYGTQVCVSLHREPPQPLEAGQLLSAVLLVCPAGDAGDGAEDTSGDCRGVGEEDKGGCGGGDQAAGDGFCIGADYGGGGGGDMSGSRGGSRGGSAGSHSGSSSSQSRSSCSRGGGDDMVVRLQILLVSFHVMERKDTTPLPGTM